MTHDQRDTALAMAAYAYVILLTLATIARFLGLIKISKALLAVLWLPPAAAIGLILLALFCLGNSR